jgi:hypothetical protein
VVADKLVGVLAVESTRPLGIDESQEAFLSNRRRPRGAGHRRMMAREEEEADPEPVPHMAPPPAVAKRAVRQFLYYPADDCIFVDGSYLVRNLPGKILWKLLSARVNEGRTEFTNRELRLDASLGLPAVERQPREPADPPAPPSRGTLPRRAHRAGGARTVRARGRRRRAARRKAGVMRYLLL